MRLLLYISILIFLSIPLSSAQELLPFFTKNENSSQLETASEEAGALLELLDRKAKIKDPYQYMSLTSEVYLATVFSSLSIAGIYLVIPKYEFVKRITTGAPEIQKVWTLPDETKCLLVALGSYPRPEVGMTQYQAILVLPSDKEVPAIKTSPLITTLWDAQTGQCSQLNPQNVPKSILIKSIRVSDLNQDGIDDILFEIEEWDCVMQKNRIYEAAYLYQEGIFLPQRDTKSRSRSRTR